MKQPSLNSKSKTKKPKPPVKKEPKHATYGTSKLELRFAHEILDRLGVKYIYQYHAIPINRYFDFAIVEDKPNLLLTETKEGIESVVQDGKNTPPVILIEIDGDYYHGNPDKYKKSELNWTQKKSKRVDGIKNRWAAMQGIVLLRFWESEIKNNPQVVAEEILKYVHGDWKRKQPKPRKPTKTA